MILTLHLGRADQVLFTTRKWWKKFHIKITQWTVFADCCFQETERARKATRMYLTFMNHNTQRSNEQASPVPAPHILVLEAVRHKNNLRRVQEVQHFTDPPKFV